MLIASYRNTERGIQAARANITKPVTTEKPLVKADDRLLPVMAQKFEVYADSLAVEMSAMWPEKKVRKYRGRYHVIVRRMCRVFGVTLNELYSERRGKTVVHARQSIYYWAWRLTPLSAVQIGHRMGGRDYSTVLYGLSMYQYRRAKMGRNLRKLREGGK